MGDLVKIINRMANHVDADEMAHDQPSHLDLHYFHTNLYQSTGLNGFMFTQMDISLRKHAYSNI